MIPLASLAAKSLGKRISKVATQQMNRAGVLTSYLMEMFKNHKLIKIFQREKYEKQRASEFINNVKESAKKIAIVYVRASPIMEFLTGIMIAFLIFFAAKLIIKDELEVNNFFSFLAAMMLAYQPVRSLATINIAIQQGITFNCLLTGLKFLFLFFNRNRKKSRHKKLTTPPGVHEIRFCVSTQTQLRKHAQNTSL